MQNEPQATIRILETTDLHMQLLGYDYFADHPTLGNGLIPLAAKIEAIRAENPTGTFLFDNGDFLQGNPLADYIAAHNLDDEPHPMIAAMSTLCYDAVCLGNHEFNYGLEFLSKALKSAPFDVVCANVTYADGSEFHPPYTIIRRDVLCSDGVSRPINLGVLGLVTPQFVSWDKTILDGKIVATDIVQTAQTMVARMKAQGADVIVALCHAGIGADHWSKGMENAAVPLAAIDGIDAVLTGHTHDLFPNNRDQASVNIDPSIGKLHGKPAVMAGFYGSHLGVVSLDITWSEGSLTIGASRVDLARADPDAATTDLQDRMIKDVMPAHTKTLNYIRQPFAATEVPINSHFATVAPNLSLQILAQAQFDQATKLAKGSEWEDLPILSAAAPFRAGGRGGPGHYIDIKPGPLTLRDAAAIYPFSNRLYVIRRTGAQILAWLNQSARLFQTLKRGMANQELFRVGVAPYDFDVIFGLTYSIDIGRDTDRVSDLCLNGKPVLADDSFVVATNSYRANGGGGFFAAPRQDILHVTANGTRDILIESLRNCGELREAPNSNWSFAPLPDTSALFVTAPHATAPSGQDKTSPTGRKVDGFAEFRLQM
ncbi:MAG: bifunctional 2',3'-cyclic-nucleotide 2'-phosphodiesterase/3'-nucleotidase [Yoonia sp.]|nr:bifunctional 2',3'-cyclic-nucleotide 2'-phosphodiesterase/3'-nucleotidase [Yoonia sp.]